VHAESWNTPHLGRLVIEFLNQHFQNCWTGWQGTVAWLPKSPDQNPLDYCFWGCMKSLVYALKSSTTDKVLNHIMDGSTDIRK